MTCSVFTSLLFILVMCFLSYKMEILTTSFLHHAQFGAMLMDMCEETLEADTLRSNVTIEVFFFYITLAIRIAAICSNHRMLDIFTRSF